MDAKKLAYATPTLVSQGKLANVTALKVISGVIPGL